jgi:hypothetical protein
MVVSRLHLVESARFDRFREARWLVVALLVLGVGGYRAGQVFGYGLLVPEGQLLNVAVPYLLIATAVVVAIAGTLWIVVDALRVRATDEGWHPNPFTYVGIYGSILTSVLYKVHVGPLAEVVSTPVISVALFVGGVLVSSVPAGPVYLVGRHQHLGGSIQERDGGEHRVD